MRYHNQFITVEEDIKVKGSKYYPAYAGRPPREVADLEEEIRQKQREFAGLIYYQRCLEFGR